MWAGGRSGRQSRSEGIGVMAECEVTHRVVAAADLVGSSTYEAHGVSNLRTGAGSMFGIVSGWNALDMVARSADPRRLVFVLLAEWVVVHDVGGCSECWRVGVACADGVCARCADSVGAVAWVGVLS